MDKYVEEEITFKDLANRLDILDLNMPYSYDIEDFGYEILSFNTETGKEEWSSLTTFIVKENSKNHYKLGMLVGTAEHRVLLDGNWVNLKDHPESTLVDEPIQVVDCTVAGTNCYVSEGQINHNSTTTGGTAIPFWASLRIKISSPSPIKKPGPSGKEEIVGVSVTAKVIKNRVDRPWRESSFDILFEEGIYEAENIFDIAREFCERNKETPILFEGKQISVAGASAWKEFNVVDNKTGEVIVSEKFYKPAFKDKILDNPQYASYVKALLDGVYVIAKDDTDHVTIGSAEPEIEKESATEM
jgi:hypothetical protein